MGNLSDWINLGRMDELARLDTPVHRLDARAKIIATIVFLVAVMSFPRHAIAPLIPFFLFPVALMNMGRIPPAMILRNLLIASPFAIVIGIFNPLLDREPVLMLGSLTITGGWISFFSILLRFALTVSAALTLVAVTGLHRLGAGLEQLGAPRAFVQQLFFLYRYLFVVVDEGATMVRAVQMRSPGLRALPLRTFGTLTGNLLLRSMDRAGRIHCAMVARGYDGTMPAPRSSTVTIRDICFVTAWVAFFIVARIWNLPAWLGSLFI
jgi:cobalt/nickel transport system permease protein